MLRPPWEPPGWLGVSGCLPGVSWGLLGVSWVANTPSDWGLALESFYAVWDLVLGSFKNGKMLTL